MKLSTIELLLGPALVLLLAGCGSSDRADESGQQTAVADDTPVVYVVNYPLKYFAERIGNDNVEVVLPDIDGDPAFWEPDPSQVADFQQADLILLNGAGYAKWVSRVSLPSARMVNTGSALDDQFIRREDVMTHTHGPGGEHTHGDIAFTTWLDPEVATEQARAIEQAFSGKWPEKTSEFAQGLADLESDLEALDRDIQTVADQIKVPLIMSHPVYQYLERRYDLDAVSVHFEPDIVPNDEMIGHLQDLLKEHPADWMVWESDPLPESVRVLKDLGLESIVFDPCGNQPEVGDYLDIMRRNVSELEKIAQSG
jgi:zinc transport system substrate-binding protein